MLLLPYERLTLATPLGADEVMRRIGEATEPMKLFRMRWSEHRTFQGEVEGDSFRIQRIINYRNSFLPVIVGRCTSQPMGSRLEVTLRLNRFASVFIVIWFATLISIGAGFVTSVWDRLSPDQFMVPLGMGLFVYVMMQGGFLFEARKARRLLTEMIPPQDPTLAALMPPTA